MDSFSGFVSGLHTELCHTDESGTILHPPPPAHLLSVHLWVRQAPPPATVKRKIYDITSMSHHLCYWSNQSTRAELRLTSLCPLVCPRLLFAAAVLFLFPLSMLTGLPLPAWAELSAALCCEVAGASLLAEYLCAASSESISA